MLADWNTTGIAGTIAALARVGNIVFERKSLPDDFVGWRRALRHATKGQGPQIRVLQSQINDVDVVLVFDTAYQPGNVAHRAAVEATAAPPRSELELHRDERQHEHFARRVRDRSHLHLVPDPD